MKIFKGKKKGIIHTMDIEWSDIRAVFFPRNFNEKYKYLGSVPWNEEGDIFKAIEPLVIFMDYKARPKWCPRWFLRYLHLFGNDNSIVRMRNMRLSNLKSRLTKGIFLVDYKTKWENYDLRISVHGDQQINDLADSIESAFYRKGYREDILKRITDIEPEFSMDYLSNSRLGEYYESLVGKMP
jgi:hypothetical protein